MPTTNQSIDIDAPIQKVWSRFDDFHDLSWAPNVITHVEWSSSWVSKEEDAVEFCHGIYVALLNELAESFKK